jgi:dihydroxy-acid dehydratase
MGGCDKTTPALLMGATSMNLPAIYLPAGPMLNSHWRDQTLGSGSDTWKYWDELRAGRISENDWKEIEDTISRSPGTCMTMGTAATMMSLAEALGFTLPGYSSIPAPDSNHARMATLTGKRIVEMVWEDLKPRDILSRGSFDNAITTLMAMGGSTNAIVHLVAMAGRAGLSFPLERYNEISAKVPVIANVRPSGKKYLMEDFFYAGGLRALLNELSPLLDLSAKTVNGHTLGENIAGAKVWNPEVILPLDQALQASGGIIMLRGNLAPDGAVLKTSAADPALQQHTGRAVVFEDYNDMAARIDSETLEVDASSVLVLKNAGPLGGPGFPEWGMLPIPKKLVRAGVKDMVRISDGRMSGTSYGTCILHVAPEAYVGGPLALVQEGDLIELNVAKRELNLKISADELAKRQAAWQRPAPKYERGYGAIFSRHIKQANEGCDFDFLEGTAPTAEPEIH